MYDIDRRFIYRRHLPVPGREGSTSAGTHPTATADVNNVNNVGAPMPSPSTPQHAAAANDHVPTSWLDMYVDADRTRTHRARAVAGPIVNDLPICLHATYIKIPELKKIIINRKDMYPPDVQT